MTFIITTLEKGRKFQMVFSNIWSPNRLTYCKNFLALAKTIHFIELLSNRGLSGMQKLFKIFPVEFKMENEQVLGFIRWFWKWSKNRKVINFVLKIEMYVKLIKIKSNVSKSLISGRLIVRVAPRCIFVLLN